ncbi:MAG: hypothetical protein AAF226_08220, partial [Verrucomicrobiota bacterium]
SSLVGNVYGFETYPSETKKHPLPDLIGSTFKKLIKSGFEDSGPLDRLTKTQPIRFLGVAGAYNSFPENVGFNSIDTDGGWMAWYSGKIKPPTAGRFRFWGYADNHLLVAINGKPIFEGSRYGSVLRKLPDRSRKNHPSLPCLNSSAGFASGEWFDATDEPVQIDLLFGEQGGHLTSGLLLIEREGASYDETYWGQPEWPLFLTDRPNEEEVEEWQKLKKHMNLKLEGSFSIDPDQVWTKASD